MRGQSFMHMVNTQTLPRVRERETEEMKRGRKKISTLMPSEIMYQSSQVLCNALFRMRRRRQNEPSNSDRHYKRRGSGGLKTMIHKPTHTHSKAPISSKTYPHSFHSLGTEGNNPIGMGQCCHGDEDLEWRSSSIRIFPTRKALQHLLECEHQVCF